MPTRKTNFLSYLLIPGVLMMRDPMAQSLFSAINRDVRENAAVKEKGTVIVKRKICNERSLN